jgi:hypothetical protein
MAGSTLTAGPAAGELDHALARLYNFDFPGTHAVLNRFIAGHPQDPLGYSLRSATYLFHELDRLGVLEAEFFADDKRIIGRKGLKPDPEIRARFFQSTADAQARAEAILARDPENADALFAMCVVQGLLSDYVALVERRSFKSLPYTKRAYACARRLLKRDPTFHDAYLSTGITEYLVGNLPFLIRWLVRFDDVQGSKQKGIENLQLVSRSGHYFRPFAKILLAVIYIREKKPAETAKLLEDLAREYPENPLIRKELTKVRAQLQPPPGL